MERLRSWFGADSAISFSEIYDGEIYDARKEIKDWCIVTDQIMDTEMNPWRKVEIIPYNREVLYSQFGCKPAEMVKVPAKRMFKTPQQDLVIDFGQNMAGWIHVCVHRAAPGEKVELACFETLDKDGNVYLDNLRGAKETIVYYCKGDETEEYHPHFTYQGFRYAKVVSYPGELKLEDVTASAVYSNMELTGSFSCSNMDLNQLWSNITWGLRSNFLDVPTDCPQRNERVGWTGDAQIFCRTASYIMNTYLFFEKWLIDVKEDQTKDGGVPHIVPDIITPGVEKVNDWLLSQGTHSAAAWADVAVLNPWNLYLTFGDKQILIDQYDSMKAWIQFMEEHSEGIIWNYKLQFGDWVALDAEEGSFYGATPNDLTCTAYYAYSTGIFAKIAAILGKTEDAKYFRDLENTIKKGFVENFFDQNTMGMKVQTQTAHIIALYFDLTPDEYKEETVDELLTLLKKENGHLVTGFVGTPYFTHALSQNGHLNEAYDLLLKEDFPSWLYQVKQGATTVWEHWDGMKPDGTMWSPEMNSFNHYAYGAIGEWMYRVIAGIEIDEEAPGYKNIIFYPRPGGNLVQASGKYESAYGTVACAWKLEKNRLTVNCIVPVNTTARIQIDHLDSIVSSPNLKYVIKDTTYTAEMGSGHYTWVFDMKSFGF
jgi:alpha-L-rhamnosidase